MPKTIIKYILLLLCLSKNIAAIDVNHNNIPHPHGIVSITTETHVQNDGSTYNITGGVQSDQTLFHQFQKFNIHQGEQAIFHDNGFDHTVVQVKGIDYSWINGRLKSSSNHFFLINSNGLFFGPHVSLDLAGSFHVSTADEFQIETSTPARDPHLEQNPVLSMTEMASFGFLNNNIGPIQIIGDPNESLPGLSVKDHQIISIIGGDIHMNDHAKIQATQGDIHIISVKSAGSVQLSKSGIYLLDINQLGEISLTNGSVVDASGTGGGNLFIRGEKLTVDNSNFKAVTTGDIDGGIMDITVSDILFTNGAYIDSSTKSFGNAGTVQIISSGEVIFKGENAYHQKTNIMLRTLSTVPDAGDAGTITIQASKISFLDGAAIDSASLGTGAGGEILFYADDQITIAGKTKLGKGSHLEVAALSLMDDAGPAGSIHMKANNIHFGGVAFINSTSDGPGMSGHVDIKAHETFSIYGEKNADRVSLIISGTWLKRANGGAAGYVSIKAKNMDVRNLSIINTSTDGDGMGGKIDIEVTETALFDDMCTIEVVTSSKRELAGDGGNLYLKAKNLILKNDSTITSNTSGHGNAGAINLDIINEILLVNSTISGEVTMDSNGGQGNCIKIKAGKITLLDNSKITTTSASVGNAGNIEIEADSIFLSGKSSIISKTTNAIGGNAGNIIIQASQLSLNDAFISTSSKGSGTGGSIMINAERINLQASQITSESLYVSNLQYDTFQQLQQNHLTTGDIVEFKDGPSRVRYFVYDNQLFYISNFYHIVDSIAAIDDLKNHYNLENGDSAWLKHPDGTVDQFIYARYAKNSGWSLVEKLTDQSVQPVEFSDIHQIYAFEKAYESTENPPFYDGKQMVFVDPETNKIVPFVYCHAAYANEVGVYVKPVRINQFLIKDPGELDDLTQKYILENHAVAILQDETGELVSTYLHHANEWIEVNDMRQFDNSEMVIDALLQSGDRVNIQSKNSNQIFTGTYWMDQQHIHTIEDLNELSLLDAQAGDIARITDLESPINAYLFVENQWQPFFQSGDAGCIEINSSQLIIDHQSIISTSTTGNADAGNIRLAGNQISLNQHSMITSESHSLFAGGQAGRVKIFQPEHSGQLEINHNSDILTDSSSSGGGIITIKNSQTILLNSNITTNVRDGAGQGGDINIESKLFVLNKSHVSANAIDGDGGAIFIVSDDFIKSSDTIIEATSERGNEGTVDINAPDLDIDSKIINLPADFLDATRWMHTQCSLRDSENGSRLIIEKYVAPSLFDGYLRSPCP